LSLRIARPRACPVAPAAEVLPIWCPAAAQRLAGWLVPDLRPAPKSAAATRPSPMIVAVGRGGNLPLFKGRGCV